MKVYEDAQGCLTIGEDDFLRFDPASGNADPWRSRLPLRLRLWDVPCQRAQVVEAYDLRLVFMGCHRTAQRFRLFVPGILCLELEIEPTEKGFNLRLFPATLIEERPNLLRLIAVDLLPDFFSATRGDSGWFFLPKYCGALLRFDRAADIEDVSMVYGEQPRWEQYNTMPVFGAKRACDAWCCILTGGQFDARIVTRLTRKDGVCRYSLCPSFLFRHEKQDALLDEVKEARFIYFGQAKADWNDMAHAYRRHLLDARGLQPLRERMRDNPALAYAAKSYHVKIFHGMKMGMTHDGDEPMTVMTSFEEAGRIAVDMQAAGIGRCVHFLVGWNAEGHDGMYPSRFPIEPALGGEAGFRRLAEAVHGLGHQLSVHDNHVDAYRRSPCFPSLELLTDRSGEPIGGSQWGGGAAWRLCPSAMPTPKSLSDLDRMKQLGVQALYYLDNLPTPLFDCHHPRHPLTRRQFAEGFRRLAQSARDRFGCVGVEGMIDYILEAIDLAWILQVPTRKLTPFDPGVLLIDELVPFYHVAVHGIVLYHADYGYKLKDAGLTLDRACAMELALGALPLNEVGFRKGWYIPGHRDQLEMMARHYQTVCGAHPTLPEQFIQRIEQDASTGEIESTYEDGSVFRAVLKPGARS